MSKKISWTKDFEDSHELTGLTKGFHMIESIVYALLVLCVLGAVYACFEKLEPKPSFLPAAEIEGLDVQGTRVKGLKLIKTQPWMHLGVL